MRITRGHFEDTSLDGLSFFAVVSFPGPLHEGNGQLQPIIDERATPEQRDALFKIMSGQNSAEGTLFHICSLIVTTMHDPVFAPITLRFDEAARTARLVIPGVLESDVEPISNPVTGAPHRVQIVMPEGFEHRVGEVASADIRSTGAIAFETRARTARSPTSCRRHRGRPRRERPLGCGRGRAKGAAVVTAGALIQTAPCAATASSSAACLLLVSGPVLGLAAAAAPG